MLNDNFSKIVSLLEKRGPIPGGNAQERKKYCYLDAGHVDSINMIQFILEIEEQFGIELTPEDIASEKFRTVDGLIKIVENKLNAKQ
jgi:acyl carrier protein